MFWGCCSLLRQAAGGSAPQLQPPCHPNVWGAPLWLVAGLQGLLPTWRRRRQRAWRTAWPPLRAGRRTPGGAVNPTRARSRMRSCAGALGRGCCWLPAGTLPACCLPAACLLPARFHQWASAVPCKRLLRVLLRRLQVAHRGASGSGSCPAGAVGPAGEAGQVVAAGTTALTPRPLRGSHQHQQHGGCISQLVAHTHPPTPRAPGLQVRVSTWRQRIDPILNDEEDRCAFDIHHYGERILGELSTLSVTERPAARGKAAAADADVQFEQVGGSWGARGGGAGAAWQPAACSVSSLGLCRRAAGRASLQGAPSAPLLLCAWCAWCRWSPAPAGTVVRGRACLQGVWCTIRAHWTPPPPGASCGLQVVTRACRDRCEVSRMFAAMLQLVNNGNVDLHTGEESPDQPFGLQLLSADMLHKQMGDTLPPGGCWGRALCLAPSVTPGVMRPFCELATPSIMHTMCRPALQELRQGLRRLRLVLPRPAGRPKLARARPRRARDRIRVGGGSAGQRLLRARVGWGGVGGLGDGCQRGACLREAGTAISHPARVQMTTRRTRTSAWRRSRLPPSGRARQRRRQPDP